MVFILSFPEVFKCVMFLLELNKTKGDCQPSTNLFQDQEVLRKKIYCFLCSLAIYEVYSGNSHENFVYFFGFFSINIPLIHYRLMMIGRLLQAHARFCQRMMFFLSKRKSSKMRKNCGYWTKQLDELLLSIIT